MSSRVIHQTGTRSAAIKALRDRLGKTQAGMAQLLNVSLRTYDRWEAGDSSPRGDVLVRMMDLCPDEATRSLFRSAAAPERSEISGKRPVQVLMRRHSAADRLRMRFRNSCLEAIRIIYEAAVLGSEAADEKLRLYADELNRTAAILTRDVVKHHRSAFE
jgi:transcriptional regulator with XRE-family HTH domain